MIDSEKSIKADTWWFHIFRSFISSGELAKIPASALKTYIALKSHTNISSGIARISLKTLACETGSSRETVKRSISKLVQLGHIKSLPSAGRVNSYKFFEHFDIQNSHGSSIGVATFSYNGRAAGSIQKELIEALKKGRTDFSSKNICYKPNMDQTTPENAPDHSIDISNLPNSLQKTLGPHLYRASTKIK